MINLIRKKEFYAYCAGLFDGEGSVYINSVDGSRYREGNTGRYYQLWVKITNTNRECLEFVQKRFGGSIYTYQEKRGKNPKPQHTLQLPSDLGMRLLSKMLPYLIIKKEKAKIGIRFQLQKNKDRIEFKGSKIPESILIEREKTRELIRK